MSTKLSVSNEVTKVKLDCEGISNLEGQLLTVIDASIVDATQRKAVKDIIRRQVWEWGNEWRWAFTEEQWKKNQSLGVGSVEAK